MKFRDSSILAISFLLPSAESTSSSSTTPRSEPTKTVVVKDLDEKLPRISPQPLAVRLHALNLIFNLGIHAHLIDKVPGGIASEGDLDRAFQMLNHLRHVLAKVIAVACYFQEENSSIVEWMLKSFLMLNTVNGKISKQTVLLIDRRFIPVCLNRINPSILAHLAPTLHLMLVNYVIPTKTLDNKRLTAVGGWRFIAEQYLQTDSIEARDNYFVVFFDLVLASLLSERIFSVTETNQEQTTFFFRLFRSVDFPQHLATIFKFLPQDFLHDFVQFLNRQFIRIRQAQSPTSTRTGVIPPALDVHLLAHVVNGFIKLGREYQRMRDEYQLLYQKMIKTPNEIEARLDDLYKCIVSGTSTDQHNASLVLFAMRYHKYDSVTPKHQSLLTHTQHFSKRLITSDSVVARSVYIKTTDRLLLALSSRLVKSWDTALSKEICNIFNEDALSILSASKRSQNIIEMVGTLFSFLINNTAVSSHGLPIQEGTSTSIYRMVIMGRYSISAKLLDLIRIDVLCKLFQRISSRNFGEVKVALLVLIMRKCNCDQNVMNTVGFEYFKVLVGSKHPELAYLASTFLINQLQKHAPEKHKSMINQILKTARETNDVSLMGNQYLQIRAILD